MTEQRDRPAGSEEGQRQKASPRPAATRSGCAVVPRRVFYLLLRCAFRCLVFWCWLDPPVWSSPRRVFADTKTALVQAGPSRALDLGRLWLPLLDRLGLLDTALVFLALHNHLQHACGDGQNRPGLRAKRDILPAALLPRHPLPNACPALHPPSLPPLPAPFWTLRQPMAPHSTPCILTPLPPGSSCCLGYCMTSGCGCTLFSLCRVRVQQTSHVETQKTQTRYLGA